MIRFGINGFGRIGRCLARLWAASPELRRQATLVQINSPSGGEMGGHLLKYDSVHGVMPQSVTWEEPCLNLDGQRILFTQHRSIDEMVWQDVDVVLECSGRYKTKEALSAHCANGVKQVLLSAPGVDPDRTIVYGVNHHTLKAEDTIISAASCTTNCLAPVLDVVMQSAEIISGLMTTIHAYTTDQNLTDASHSDWRRARAASHSMIPTKTGAAAAIGEVLPALAGRLNGLAVRVPTANVSLLDLTLNLDHVVSAKEINQWFEQAAQGTHEGILGCNHLPLVSCDFNRRAESSIIDLSQTMVHGNTVKIMAWYDNEWAFASRMIDLMLHWVTVSKYEKKTDEVYA